MEKFEKEPEEHEQGSGFISLIFDFLKLIFKLSFINFEKKKSKYTLNKNFEKLFEQRIKEDKKSFKNFICYISDELKSIDELLKLNSKDMDFKAKDINLDILMPSINNCFLYSVNEISEKNLINELKNCFRDLIKRKKIQSNKESNIIISNFDSNIDAYENYLNELKVKKFSNKLEEKKDDINEEYYMEIIGKLRNEVNDYKNMLDKKDIEIKEIKDKNKELNMSLSEIKIQSALDKSTYEEINKNFKNEIRSLLSEHSKEIQSLKKKVQNLEIKVEKLENENMSLKSKLAFSEKKIETLVNLIDSVRKDMETLADIGKDFANNLDMTTDLLLEVKYTLDKYDIELDNLGNIIP